MGELIQMNAHMIRTGIAEFFMGLGFMIAIIAVIAAFMVYGESRRGFIIAVCTVGIGIGLMVYGVTKPKVKEIMACANGPVSLEQVAAVYDIVDIDGKMLTLRER